MNGNPLDFTKYNLTHNNITCLGVNWEKRIFLFSIKGIKYLYEQKKEISCSADTDHIRCVIDEFVEQKKEELFQREIFGDFENDLYRVIFFQQESSIVGYALVPNDWSEDILFDKINSYNSSNEEGKIAICKIFPKKSYIGYLFEKMIEKKNYNKQVIQDAIDALENAKEFIYSLENI